MLPGYSYVSCWADEDARAVIDGDKVPLGCIGSYGVCWWCSAHCGALSAFRLSPMLTRR